VGVAVTEMGLLRILQEGMPKDAGLEKCKTLGCAVARSCGFAHDQRVEIEQLKADFEEYELIMKEMDWRGIEDAIEYLNRVVMNWEDPPTFSIPLKLDYVRRLLSPFLRLKNEYLARTEAGD